VVVEVVVRGTTSMSLLVIISRVRCTHSGKKKKKKEYNSPFCHQTTASGVGHMNPPQRRQIRRQLS
jgi:hypothetical protein